MLSFLKNFELLRRLGKTVFLFQIIGAITGAVFISQTSLWNGIVLGAAIGTIPGGIASCILHLRDPALHTRQTLFIVIYHLGLCLIAGLVALFLI